MGMWGCWGGDVRFSTTVAVVIFILISSLEILWVFFLDLSVCHVVADAGVEFVEGFPL